VICNNCKRTFDTPGTHTDDVGYSFSACPYCESDEIEDSHACPICLEEIPASVDYCDRHVKEVWGELYKIWDYYDRSDAAKQIMNDWVEEVW
jgi:hypothetical protein